jgi:hypothetical protein
VLAAQQLGITDVPTMVARGWTQAQIQAYRVADNQLALNAGWDRELLGIELGELKLGGFDRKESSISRASETASTSKPSLTFWRPSSIRSQSSAHASRLIVFTLLLTVTLRSSNLCSPAMGRTI